MSSFPYYVNPSVRTSVKFAPVKVEKGRKFKGRGFIVAEIQNSGAIGWKHTGYGWAHNYYETTNAKIWVPAINKFCYANIKYVEPDTAVTEADCKLYFDLYVNHIISDTINWCKSVKPELSEVEIMKFAMNVLRKHHKEILDEINGYFDKIFNAA